MALQEEANRFEQSKLICSIRDAVVWGQDRLYLLDAAALWEC